MSGKNPFKQLRTSINNDKGKPLSIVELGKILGISYSCISKIERNIHVPTLDIIIAYQKYFDVPYEFLIKPVFPYYSQISTNNIRKK